MAEADINRYEGLIYKTAVRVVERCDLELDDIRQELRIKVWRSLEAFDPTRSSQPEERFVFSCVFNLAKDIVKKRRRGEVFIEDIAPAEFTSDAFAGKMGRDYFEQNYLSLDGDLAFAEVEEEGLVVPSTLNARERLVLVRLYRDYRAPNASEIARELGLSRSQMETTMAGIRTKMADWRPDVVEVEEEAVPMTSAEVVTDITPPVSDLSQAA